MSTRGRTQEGSPEVPELVAGDRLTRSEFERRYEALPDLKKAELIDGRVYIPIYHGQCAYGEARARLGTWLGLYVRDTPGVTSGLHSTIRLDHDNEPQPDALLLALPEHGGQARIAGDGFLVAVPDLVADVVPSSASYALHEKLNVYRRSGLREYIVWRLHDQAIDWLMMERGSCRPLSPGDDGILRSIVFPGLWVNVDALISDDRTCLQRCLREGLASPEHAAFVEQLQSAAQPDEG